MKNINFHLKQGDYFGTLATRLSLLRQLDNNENKQFLEIEKELLFLQENFRIINK